tara:strand:+ start:313 stop:561 length:249 start_codon:yes stop_codon:yes gene_type:complete
MKAIIKLLANPSVTVAILDAIVDEFNRDRDSDELAVSLLMAPEIFTHVKNMEIEHLLTVSFIHDRAIGILGGSPIQPSERPS